MEKTYIGVRDVNEETFRKFRAMTVEEKLKLGEALTKAMLLMIEQKKKEKNQKLINIKPRKVGNTKLNWSKEIDEFLYK